MDLNGTAVTGLGGIFLGLAAVINAVTGLLTLLQSRKNTRLGVSNSATLQAVDSKLIKVESNVNGHLTAMTALAAKSVEVAHDTARTAAIVASEKRATDLDTRSAAQDTREASQNARDAAVAP